MEIPVIFEDNHLLAVIKPPNILSQGDNSGDKDMLSILKEKIKTRDNKPGNVYLGLLHRLDRPVGGVMVFAKTSKSASRLSAQIREREFKKGYLAVVHGVPEKKKDILENYLLKNRKTNTVSVVDKGTEGAQKAVLDYEVLDYSDGYSLLKVNLHTGRPHQIRVQLAAIGYPLYGDQRYGYRVNKKGQQIALWSHTITCKHPIFNAELSFISYPAKRGIWSKFELEQAGQGCTIFHEDWTPEQRNALSEKLIIIKKQKTST
ncbi:MAG: RNA pseudouridine synthase [Halanaerobiaceae bacterium]|nr:RNA pseudouridine synthase [Halanaerobiaceae bacterium]